MPDKVKEAVELGAAGVQVGTAFAFSEESGMRQDLKTDTAGAGYGRHREGVYRSAGVAHGISVQSCAACRVRIPMRAWRTPEPGCAISAISASRMRLTSEKIGYRCSAEPVANYVAKGGKIEDTVGRKCLVQCADGKHRPRADAQGRFG